MSEFGRKTGGRVLRVQGQRHLHRLRKVISLVRPGVEEVLLSQYNNKACSQFCFVFFPSAAKAKCNRSHGLSAAAAKHLC